MVERGGRRRGGVGRWISHRPGGRRAGAGSRRGRRPPWVIRPGGYWAAWWNEAAADGEDWLADYHAAMAAACPAYSQHRRAADAEWSAAPIAATSQFSPRGCVVTQWTRTPRLDEWLTSGASPTWPRCSPPIGTGCCRRSPPLSPRGFPMASCPWIG